MRPLEARQRCNQAWRRVAATLGSLIVLALGLVLARVLTLIGIERYD